MRQTVLFQNGKLHIAGKNIAIVSSLIINIFFWQSLLVAQVKMDTMGQPAQDSSKDITIHQEINFKANSTQLYETLLSSKKFSDDGDVFYFQNPEHLHFLPSLLLFFLTH